MYQIEVSKLKKLLREVITTEYVQECKKDARDKLNKLNTVEEIIENFKVDCYTLARNWSGIMPYKY